MDFIFDLLILAFFSEVMMQMFAIPYFVFLFLDRTQRSMFRHLQSRSSRNLCHFGSVPEDEDTRPSDCQVFGNNHRTHFSHG